MVMIDGEELPHSRALAEVADATLPFEDGVILGFGHMVDGLEAVPAC